MQAPANETPKLSAADGLALETELQRELIGARDARRRDGGDEPTSVDRHIDGEGRRGNCGRKTDVARMPR